MDQRLSKFSRAMVMAALTSLACGTALAQWQWVDSSGRKVFSDTPPPAGTPDKSILKRPGARNPAPVVTDAAATPATLSPTSISGTTTATAAVPKLSGRDAQLEAKKKQAEEAEQAKKKVEADKQAKTRTQNCDRAKAAKGTLDSGIRIATTNAKGEREIMDDKSRASEAKRIDEVIRSDCGPLPPIPQ